MKKKNELKGRDRDFFRLVSRMSFSNPFETKTFDLTNAVAGGQYKTIKILNKHLIERVRQRLGAVVLDSGLSWKAFSGEDKELIRVALLYDTYHNCHDDFDSLILQQIEAGESPCNVPFAEQIPSLLKNFQIPLF